MIRLPDVVVNFNKYSLMDWLFKSVGKCFPTADQVRSGRPEWQDGKMGEGKINRRGATAESSDQKLETAVENQPSDGRVSLLHRWSGHHNNWIG